MILDTEFVCDMFVLYPSVKKSLLHKHFGKYACSGMDSGASVVSSLLHIGSVLLQVERGGLHSLHEMTDIYIHTSD